MPFFTATIDKFIFDDEHMKKVKEVFALIILKALKGAIEAFYKAGIKRIPIRTGFAYGGFTAIGQAVGASGVKSPAATKSQAFSRVFGLRAAHLRSERLKTRGFIAVGAKKGGAKKPQGFVEYYKSGGQRIQKSFDTGRSFGKALINGVRIQDFQTNQIHAKYQVDLSVNISYFNINEEFPNPYTPSSPWKVFAAGEQAFIDFLNRYDFERELSFFNYVTVTELKLTKSGSILRRTKRVKL